MTDVLEKMARVFRDARDREEGRQRDIATNLGYATTDDIWWGHPPTDTDREFARAALRVALEDMREPSEGMIEAYLEASRGGPRLPSEQSKLDWQAMHDRYAKDNLDD